MPSEPLLRDELVQPITAEQPAGVDLRWTAEWDQIREARRSDDSLESGKWAKRDQKTSDWPLVRSLVSKALRLRSKDLQLALWLTEAELKLLGFCGLKDGLWITRELIVRYWDNGLHPQMEDGPEDRTGPFEWLNSKLGDSIEAISITPRSDGGTEYSYIDLKDARRVGSESNWKTGEGLIDEGRKKNYEKAIADGRISMEMFERALKESKRSEQEALTKIFEETFEEFRSLEKILDEKFGDVGPNLADCRTSLSEVRQALLDGLEKKRKEEPDAPVLPQAPPELSPKAANGRSAVNYVNHVSPLFPDSDAEGTNSWQAAEALIYSGQVEMGLREMTLLAAKETTGRSRFQRKRLLAEVCLATKRERLGRSILEELAGQIDKCQLELWESSELISSVWTKLLRLYKQGTESSDAERAEKLYERLCRLDPWQALDCGEE